MEFGKSKITYFLIFISSVLFAYFLFTVKNGEPLAFDRYVSTFLINLFAENNHFIFKWLNATGSGLGIGIITLFSIAVIWIKKRDYAGMAVFAFAITSGSLLNKWLKELVGRPRPDVEHLVYVKSPSFPSGHSMMNMILFMLIAYFVISVLSSRQKKWLVSILAALYILMMGISRIVLQVHYPSDVVAGILLGFIWASIWLIIYESLKDKLYRTS